MNKEKDLIIITVLNVQCLECCLWERFRQDRLSFLPGCFAWLCEACSTGQEEIMAWVYTLEVDHLPRAQLDWYLLGFLSKMLVVLASARPHCVWPAVTKNGRLWLNVATAYRGISCYIWRIGTCRSCFVEWDLQRVECWVDIPSEQDHRKRKTPLSALFILF